MPSDAMPSDQAVVNLATFLASATKLEELNQLIGFTKYQLPFICASFFGFLAMLNYALDGFLKFRQWKTQHSAAPPQGV